MIETVRARLTLWYVAVLAAALFVVGGLIYVLLAGALYARIDDNLKAVVEIAMTSLANDLAEGQDTRDAARSTAAELASRQQMLAIYDATGQLLAEEGRDDDLEFALPPLDMIPTGDVLLGTKELFEPIQQALVTRFGDGKWLMATAGSSPYLNYELIEKLQLDASEVRRVAAAAAARVPHVARVYTRDELLRGNVPNDRIGSRVSRGFNAQRSGDLEIILEPYWMRQAQGTTHGTRYSYDAHIPFILMGVRVKPGEYAGEAALNDLAPTLATLAGVEIPAGSAGRVLSEALRPLAAETPRRRP